MIIEFLLTVLMAFSTIFNMVWWFRQQRKYRKSLPTPEEMVFTLVYKTASLALIKGEYVEFAMLPGVCGNFKLTGNSLPCFTYTVFEKKIMEFIEVTVEISKPDRIQFTSRITSTTAPERHGEEVETKDKYKKPFIKLAHHLCDYFPFPMEGGKKKQLDNQGPVKNAQEIQVQNVNSSRS